MRKPLIVVLIVVLMVLYTSMFVVQEGQRGIVMRFGKVLRDNENKPLVYAPGLHFKIPFLESVKSLDARIQTMDNQADRFVTKEKKDLIVDSYIKWRVSDFSRYYLATGGGDVSQAEVLLKRKFSDRLRSEIGRLDVKDIVTDSRGRLTTDVRDALNTGSVGQDDDVATPAADDAIASVAKRVERETNSNEPAINPKPAWLRWVFRSLTCVSSRLTCRPKFLTPSMHVCAPSVNLLPAASVLRGGRSG